MSEKDVKMGDLRKVAAKVWKRQQRMGIAVPVDPTEPLRTTIRRRLEDELRHKPRPKR